MGSGKWADGAIWQGGGNSSSDLLVYCSLLAFNAQSYGLSTPHLFYRTMANPIPSRWRKPLLHVALFFGGIYLYALLMEVWGGFSTHLLYLQWPEVILVLYFYGLIYSLLKPSGWRPWLAGVPIFLVYLVHDIFYLVYGKVFRFINVAEVPELLQILPPAYAILLVIGFITPFALILARIDYRRPMRIVLVLLPLVMVVTLIKATPSAFATGFKSIAHEIVKYSDGKSVESNGRLAMLLFREAEREETLAMIEPYLNRPGFDKAFAREVEGIRPYLKPRNVHLIVLESFLDPRLFRDLKLSRDPVHPDFAALFGDKLGLSVSPVFGGATSQAEFEVLCGVPAFERLSSVEFNTFTGAQAHCLPGLLAELGYRAIASNAYKPNFFNTQAAYKGMGFAEQQFPVEFYTLEPTYLKFGDPGEEEYLFDGDLFPQNLDLVRRHLEEHPDQPLFNYMLTIYGHMPNILNADKRPAIIDLKSNHPDEQLDRVVNQFYYRTQAIAHYARELIALDPNSLIVLISDHVPPLQFGPSTYKALDYMGNQEGSYFYNRLAILENGKPVAYDPMRHFDMPKLIMNYLTQGHYCATGDCDYLVKTKPPRDTYFDKYLALMAHASE